MADRPAPAFIARLLTFFLCLVGGWLSPTIATALPRLHPPSVATWDPRTSSLSFGSHSQSSGEGSLSSLSTTASFSSVSTRLSSQFGAHYLSFQRNGSAPEMEGFSLSALALYSVPLSEQVADLPPKGLWGFYLGVLPTGVFALEESFVSIPIVLGTGFPWSPSRFLSLTPWVEVSRSSEIDANINDVSTEEAVLSAADGTLTRDEIEELVEEGISVKRYSTWAGRAGLSLALRLGQRVDLNGGLTLGYGRGNALGLSASLVVRWDDFAGSFESLPPAEAETPVAAPVPAAARPTRSRPNSNVRPTPTPKRPTRPRRPRFRQVKPPQ